MEALAVGMAMSAVSTVWLNKRVSSRLKDKGDAPSLRDIVHCNTPPIPVWVPDILLAGVALLFQKADLDDAPIRFRALGLAFAARAVTIHMTLLPSPVPVGSYCHGWDLWVSGHTLAFCAFSAATPGLSTLGALTLIVSRQHYTIDVVGACMLYKICFDACAAGAV